MSISRLLPAAALALACAACGAAKVDDTSSLANQKAFWADAANRDRHEAFVLASTRFILLHEMAHYMVSDYKLPVLGREEDAADRFATVMMTPDPTETTAADSIGSASASPLLWVSWLLIHMGKSGEQDRAKMPWFDEHAMDEQRGYQVLCLLYGTNPQRFQQAAIALGLPESRRRSCLDEAERNIEAWEPMVTAQIATPAEQQANARRESLLRSMPPGVLYFQYTSPETFNSPEVPWPAWNSENFLKQHRVLETFAKNLERLKVPAGKSLPTVIAAPCEGMVNASWDAEKRTVTICYPLVDRFSWAGRSMLWEDHLARQKQKK